MNFHPKQTNNIMFKVSRPRNWNFNMVCYSSWN